jgi:chromosome segregation ATPase
LEQNLSQLLYQHGRLQNSYNQQEGELNILRTRIASLQNELAQLRLANGRDLEFGVMLAPEDFEGFRF